MICVEGSGLPLQSGTVSPIPFSRYIYLLSACYDSGTLLGAEDTAVKNEALIMTVAS